MLLIVTCKECRGGGVPVKIWNSRPKPRAKNFARTKGARGELELVHFLQEAGFPSAERSAVQSKGGAVAPDVIGTPWWVECKRRGTDDAYKWLQQAERDREANDSNKKAVTFHRLDGQTRWAVTMWADHFLNLHTWRKSDYPNP